MNNKKVTVEEQRDALLAFVRNLNDAGALDDAQQGSFCELMDNFNLWRLK